MKLREYFFCSKKTEIAILFKNVFSSLSVEITVEPLMSMDYFNDVLTTFLGLERVSCVAVYAGSESSQI